MSEQEFDPHEFLNVDEALAALTRCVYMRGRADERSSLSLDLSGKPVGKDAMSIDIEETAAREWLRAAVASAQNHGWPREEMMTRRELLEEITRKEKLRLSHPNPTPETELCDFEYQLALLNAAHIHAPMVPIWGIGGKRETRVSRAIHELALLMNVEREERKHEV